MQLGKCYLCFTVRCLSYAKEYLFRCAVLQCNYKPSETGQVQAGSRFEQQFVNSLPSM